MICKRQMETQNYVEIIHIIISRQKHLAYIISLAHHQSTISKMLFSFHDIKISNSDVRNVV